jgi:L-fuconolactonase
MMCGVSGPPWTPEPVLSGVDAHVHLMAYDPVGHDWVTDELSALRRDFLLEDLRPLLAASGFGSCVAVQARQNPAENEFLLALAQPPSVVSAVVGWVDLTAEDVGDVVQSLARRPAFVGARHVLIDEPDDGYLLRPEFQRGLRALAGAGLAYDLLIAPRHLAGALTVVDAHPDLRFVVDHAGLPDIARGDWEDWLPGLQALARREHVACKLSGLELMADWVQWSPGDLRPYQEAVLTAFGPERLMLGSNWPVCTVAGGYQRAVAAGLELVDGLAVHERAAVLGDTCRHWYGIRDARR